MSLQLKKILLFFAVAAAFSDASEASAQQPSGLDAQDQVVTCRLDAVEYTLSDLLSKVARRMGKSARVHDRVRGFVVGRGDRFLCADLMDFVEAVFDLLIFDDGRVLHVATTEKLESAVIELAGGNSTLFIDQLRSMSLVREDQLPRPTSNGKAIYISGHPQYVKIVRDLANTKQAEHGPRVKILFGGK